MQLKQNSYWFTLLATLFLFLTSCQTAATSTTQQISAPELEELVSEIETGEYGRIHSLLVWHQDTLVLEEYFDKNDSETREIIYSATKSVTSAAIGIALEDGEIDSLDTPLLSFFPQYATINNDSEWKQAITVEDILKMSAGLSWDELSSNYGSEQNDATLLVRSSDWTKYMLDKEVVFEPGTQFVYSSGETMLLSGIIQTATGQTAEDYTAEHLLTPLGITDWLWESGNDGLTNTGWGLHLRPSDMLKFGRLYLNNGAWEGEQIISEGWIQQSTQTQIGVGDDFAYGYQWWRFDDSNQIVADLETNDLYFAWGYGGQFIFVVPHLEMVIVTTAANFEDGAKIFPALPDHIFPAVLDE